MASSCEGSYLRISGRAAAIDADNRQNIGYATALEHRAPRRHL